MSAKRNPPSLDPVAVRIVREARGWSQVDLARHAGRHLTTISLLERGSSVTPSTADAVRKALGIADKGRAA